MKQPVRWRLDKAKVRVRQKSSQPEPLSDRREGEEDEKA
jgi:hypothetical protein